MTNHSVSELERQAEQVRQEISDTASSIRGRLSPGQLLDEFMDQMKGSDSSLALSNLKSQARDNPLALGMIGMGMAWLMAGPRMPLAKGHHREHVAAKTYRSGLDADAYRESAPDLFGEAGDSAQVSQGGLGYLDPRSGEGLRAAGEQADNAFGTSGDDRSTAQQARDRLAGGASGIGDAAHDAGDRLSSGASAIGDKARDAGSYARHEAGAFASYSRHAFFDTLQREPLIIGALGLAVGAAIGALMPSTEVEDRYLGRTSDRLKDDAAEAVEEGMEKAKAAADRGFKAAKDEADKQGLMPHGEAAKAEDKATDDQNNAANDRMNRTAAADPGTPAFQPPASGASVSTPPGTPAPKV